MPCFYCGEEHEGKRVRFKLSGKEYDRSAFYCDAMGRWVIDVTPSIPEYGAKTLAMESGDCTELK